VTSGGVTVTGLLLSGISDPMERRRERVNKKNRLPR
jgi:hypothetical protein